MELFGGHPLKKRVLALGAPPAFSCGLVLEDALPLAEDQVGAIITLRRSLAFGEGGEEHFHLLARLRTSEISSILRTGFLE